MANLTTKYMGLTLKNPIVAASSNLTSNVEGLKNMEDNGVGAVVLKSLFEEQIRADLDDFTIFSGSSWEAEAYEYVSQIGMKIGSEGYLELIREAKKAIDVPVIANLNCISADKWLDYAKQIQKVGADGLELNIAYPAGNFSKNSRKIEKIYLNIIDRVRSVTKLPIAVKLGQNFTSLGSFSQELRHKDIQAIALFNRFCSIDLDIQKEELIANNSLSSANDYFETLRWISILYERTECDLAATTGIHDSNAIIKQLLSGASVVQICSVLYKQGIECICKLTSEIENWMDEKGYGLIEDFQGKLSQKNSLYPEVFDRVQYLKNIAKQD